MFGAAGFKGKYATYSKLVQAWIDRGLVNKAFDLQVLSF